MHIKKHVKKNKKIGYNRFQFKFRIQGSGNQSQSACPPFSSLYLEDGDCGLPAATGGYSSPGDRLSGRGGTGMPSYK